MEVDGRQQDDDRFEVQRPLTQHVQQRPATADRQKDQPGINSQFRPRRSSSPPHPQQADPSQQPRHHQPGKCDHGCDKVALGHNLDRHNQCHRRRQLQPVRQPGKATFQ